MVSERLGTRTTTDMFYRIYKRDLPVLITTDAILHAWHRSYDAILVKPDLALFPHILNTILSSISRKDQRPTRNMELAFLG